jgi:hypothetical protein
MGTSNPRHRRYADARPIRATHYGRRSWREYQQYIGGEWIGSAKLFDDLDPYRGTVMARIPAGTRADAARADAAVAGTTH